LCPITNYTNEIPYFRVDDRGLKLGVELYTNIALDYLSDRAKKKK